MNKSFKLPVVILANGSFPTHHIPIEQLKMAGTVICTDGAANYLSKIGWKTDQPCFYKIVLKKNIPNKFLNTSAQNIKNKRKKNKKRKRKRKNSKEKENKRKK